MAKQAVKLVQDEATETTLITVAVTCEGRTPLLMNRVQPETLLMIRDKSKKPKTAPPKGAPREEAANKVYEMPDGRFYVPSVNLMSALIAAGQFIRLDGKRQVSTAKSTVLPAFLTLLDPEIVLDTPGWEVDIRAGRNPNGGEMVCLVRPRFDKWVFTANVQIDTAEIGERVIRDIFDAAGKRCGLGDFRPNRKGVYGQFVVRCWRRQEETHPSTA